MAVTEEDMKSLRNSYQRKYEKRHMERVKAYRKRYYQEHRAERLAYQNEYNRKKREGCGF